MTETLEDQLSAAIGVNFQQAKPSSVASAALTGDALPPSRNLAAASAAPGLKIVGAVGTGEATARSS